MPRDSPLDVALSAALAEHGVMKRPRTLERARQAGLLETRPKTGLGYPGGSRAEPGPDELERAIEAFRLFDQHRTYDRAVLAMFVQGRYTVAKDKLERAFAGSLQAALKAIERHGPRFPVEDFVAAAASWLAGRAAKARQFALLRKHLREGNQQWRSEGGRLITVTEQLDHLFQDMLMLFVTGKATSMAGLAELLDGFGVTVAQLTRGEIPEEAPRDAVAEILGYGGADAIVAKIHASSLASLETAREEATIFRDFARAYVERWTRFVGGQPDLPWEFVASASDIALAWAVPGLISLRASYPAKMDEFIVACRTFVG